MRSASGKKAGAVPEGSEGWLEIERQEGRSVNEKDSETTSAAVPDGAKPAEEIDGRWPWVERSVWSERMLWALENGVKGGQWFSLIDKVWKRENLGAPGSMGKASSSSPRSWARSWRGKRPFPMAQCLLCRPRAIQSGKSSEAGSTISMRNY